jgi:hypothetical protein
MWQPEKLDRYKDKLEEVKEVAGVLIAVVTIASFVKKRVQNTNPTVGTAGSHPSQENNS